jgi:hypothetical protein
MTAPGPGCGSQRPMSRRGRRPFSSAATPEPSAPTYSAPPGLCRKRQDACSRAAAGTSSFAFDSGADPLYCLLLRAAACAQV